MAVRDTRVSPRSVPPREARGFPCWSPVGADTPACASGAGESYRNTSNTHRIRQPQFPLSRVLCFVATARRETRGITHRESNFPRVQRRSQMSLNLKSQPNLFTSDSQLWALAHNFALGSKLNFQCCTWERFWQGGVELGLSQNIRYGSNS